jgi:hypothetical protein
LFGEEEEEEEKGEEEEDWWLVDQVSTSLHLVKIHFYTDYRKYCMRPTLQQSQSVFL